MMKRRHQETSVEEAHSMGKNLEDDNMDDFLTVLGYKVRFSVADVAQNLEQLEMVLSNVDVFVFNALNNTIHYNPSDLSGWAETMLLELNYFSPSPHSDLTVMCNLRPEDDECCSTSSKRIQRIGTWCESHRSEQRVNSSLVHLLPPLFPLFPSLLSLLHLLPSLFRLSLLCAISLLPISLSLQLSFLRRSLCVVKKKT
ncbi:hypothetical protein F2Q70_00002105 [Brassica cretica]|uniref:Transcriptional factor DELLA N-terminal domain-containing protein n=1 Tax=Brassica cretica TaxID=69181 RepID=A0A8S9IRB1_BRACR|nr:hypothetical protein F2Q70_00002105 [Brassica cretica]